MGVHLLCFAHQPSIPWLIDVMDGTHLLAPILEYNITPMKTAITLVALVFTAVAFGQNPVLNPGFESWTPEGEPTDWNTNNDMFMGVTISPEGSGYGGSDAVHGEVVFGEAGLNTPYLVSALDNGDPHPISQSYTNLSFYYKLELVSDVGVEVFTAGVVLQDAAGNGIAGGSVSLNSSANTSTYTLANVPINYFGAAPVGATITFLIVGPGIAQGSHYVVDDVSLNFLSTGIGETEAADVLSVPYPSPTIDAVNLPFTLASASEVSMVITDAQGRMVEIRDLGALGQGSYKEVLAVAAWAPGIYTCTLTTNSASRKTTFVVDGMAR
jgi:hypothetical protein